MRKQIGMVLLLLLGIAVILPMQVQAHPIWQGKVTWVYDGDTLLIGGKKIRLALTDANELGTVKGNAAKTYVISVCYGKIATIHVDSGQPLDKYGRTVASVYCSTASSIDGFLNYQILVKRYGVIDARFCNISEFGTNWWAKIYGC